MSEEIFSTKTYTSRPVTCQAFRLTKEAIEAAVLDRVELPLGIRVVSSSYLPSTRTVHHYRTRLVVGEIEIREGDWAISLDGEGVDVWTNQEFCDEFEVAE